MHNPIGEPRTMPIEVNSPHSGRPVKVRDQDVGRAVRDQEGRIFYVVLRSNGQGYYGAPTRHGSPKDEQRYIDMERTGRRERPEAEQRPAVKVHDATGRRRGVGRRVTYLLAFLLVVAALALLLWSQNLPFSDRLPHWLNRGEPAAPSEPADAPSRDSAN